MSDTPMDSVSEPSMIRVYPSGSSSTPSVAVVTLREGSTTSVPPPPLQPSQVSGAAQRTMVRRRERRCDTGDIAALQGRLARSGGAPTRLFVPVPLMIHARPLCAGECADMDLT